MDFPHKKTKKGLMKQLFREIKPDEMIEYIQCNSGSSDIIKEYFRIYFPDEQDNWFEYCNYTTKWNCYHNIMAWQLNNKLRDGWSLVGSDNDSFIIAKNNGI
ncbi:MAG: hypothetical protein COY53_07290 [Elusimicrobia bacterium CG_4_10_14_0_8_um_filter_37_32]|nr:MAG: hypothetical protein COY53_07290 [Elusimicrobia bacterium CG_4_10_14_0_8_um_filter_37_32]